MLRPVLLAGRDGEQRWFGGRGDLDYSAPRVRWLRTPLRTPLRGKAEAQGSRPSKPEQAREEGDVPDREQQRDSCPSRATSVGFGQGIGHLPVSVT